MEFGERIKTQRNKLGLTQAKVAKRLYVTRQTISNWEQGKSYPDLNMLVKISDVYQISIDALLKEDKQLNERISRGQAYQAFLTVIGLSWVLYGIFTFYQSTVRASLIGDILSLLMGIIVLSINVFQLYKMPLFSGVSQEEFKKMAGFNPHSLVNWVMVIIILAPIVIAAFLPDFLSAIVRGTDFTIIGIVEIILTYRSK